MNRKLFLEIETKDGQPLDGKILLKIAKNFIDLLEEIDKNINGKRTVKWIITEIKNEKGAEPSAGPVNHDVTKKGD
jgi:hypothetical protein